MDEMLLRLRDTVPAEDRFERIKQARYFTRVFLEGLSENDAEAIIIAPLKEHFNLNTEEVNNIKRYSKDLHKKKVPEERIPDLLKSDGYGAGIFECGRWVNENELSIAKIPSELLKKRQNPKSKAYEYTETMTGVQNQFKLSEDELEEIYLKMMALNYEYHQEKKKLDKIILRLQNDPKHIIEKAEKLLLEGNPQEYISQTWKKKHIGDEALGKTLPVCVASSFIVGRNAGLGLKASGGSGKGKSSGIDAFLDLLPPYMLVKGGLSDKYLYYTDEVLPGSMFFVDDKELSKDLNAVVKDSITNFQKSICHRTIINGEPRELNSPIRIVWIFASVLGFDDEQINNRLIQVDVDASTEQDSRVSEFQRQSECADTSANYKEGEEVCHCIYDLLSLKTYDIRIPFSGAIIWYHEENRRNQPKFFDMIRAVCLYKIYQREQVNGYYLATLEDYDMACEIYKETAVQTNLNLTKSELKILECLTKKLKLSYDEIAECAGLTKENLRVIINGRDFQHPGLLRKVRGLSSEKVGSKKVFTFNGNIDSEKYKNFSSLTLNIDELIGKNLESLKKEPASYDRIRRAAFEEVIPTLQTLTSLNLH